MAGKIQDGGENVIESEVQASNATVSPPRPKEGEEAGDVDLLDDLDDPGPVGTAPDPGSADGEWKAPSEGLEEGDEVLIHFVEDGFTALQQMWYRGQELRLKIGSAHWDATVDMNGDSWVLRDEETQIRMHGKVMFRPGPWPHGEFEDERARDLERKRAQMPSHPAPGIF